MYSFSTCWNSHRHTDGRALLREIRALGFEYAELSHGIRVSLLPGIIEAVQAGEMRISSLHNFCPLPMGVNHAAPNLYVFSSTDSRERESAFRHTVKTIETAARLGAPVVVLHMGCIDIKDYTDRLLEMLQRGLQDSPKFSALRDEALAKCDKKKGPYLQYAGESLERIVTVAEQHGIKLGIENRQEIEEIPLDWEFDAFLMQFPGPSVGYWHDFGHAQIKEHLGVSNHRVFLQALSGRMLGCHVHDVKYPGRDHAAPGTGSVDFAGLGPLLRPEHIKVFEFSPSLSPEEAAAGVAFVKSKWGAE